jgi:hypothetical protein
MSQTLEIRGPALPIVEQQIPYARSLLYNVDRAAHAFSAPVSL